jgi:ADP-ribose pyrophosphatase YjhB (NUDIX family)
MSEQLLDATGNLAPKPKLIEKMELPAPLYDWAATGAQAVDGHAHGSVLPTLYADSEGRLLNPYGPKEERGDEGQLRHEGPNRTNCIALVRQTQKTDGSGNLVTKWQLLAIQRLRTEEFALPGGFQDLEDTDSFAGGLRELTEETGVRLPFDKQEARQRVQTMFSGPTLSPRATTYKWIETEVNVIFLSSEEGAAIEGTPQDDASAAEWVDLDELASGQVGDSQVRPSHVPYFRHMQTELAGFTGE